MTDAPKTIAEMREAAAKVAEEWERPSIAHLIRAIPLPADDAEMVEKVAAAILASRATSDEGPFDPLWQLLDFAPNNNRIIARAAARAALSAMRGEP